jgi:hypothetical protein
MLCSCLCVAVFDVIIQGVNAAVFVTLCVRVITCVVFFDVIIEGVNAAVFVTPCVHVIRTLNYE